MKITTSIQPRIGGFRSFSRIRTLASSVLASAALLLPLSMQAATTYYLDLNGATGGFGTATAGATYKTGDALWSTTAAGSATTAAVPAAGGNLQFGGAGGEFAGVEFTVTNNSGMNASGALAAVIVSNSIVHFRNSGNPYGSATWTAGTGGTLIWESGNYNDNGGTVTLAGPGRFVLVAPPSNPASGKSGGLTMSGTGAAYITGTSSSGLASGTSVYTLSAGILNPTVLANGGAASSIGGGQTNAANLVFNGGTLQYSNASVSINRKFTINASKTAIFDITQPYTTLTFSDLAGWSVQGTSGIQKKGPGTLNLDTVADQVYLGGINALTVSQGTLASDSGHGVQINLGATSGDAISIAADAGASVGLWTVALSSQTAAANQNLHVTGSSGTATINSFVQLVPPNTLGAVNTKTVNIDAGATGLFNNLIWTYTNYVGQTHLLKTGAGTMTLAAVNTYVGNTTNYAGTIALAPGGGISGSPIICLSGGTLDVSAVSGGFTLNGAIGQTLAGTNSVTGNVTVESGATVAVGVGTTPGVLTMNNDLTFVSGGTLALELSNVAGAANNDLLVVNGNLSSTGPIAVNFSFLNGAPDTSGTPYTIITCNGSIDPGFLANLSAGSTYAATFSRVGNSIQVSFGGLLDPNLVWQGDGVGGLNQWVVGVANEWTNSAGASTTFFNGANATFDDTASSYAVTVQGTLKPASWTVNSAHNYDFEGAGKISGATGLSKSGSGTLVIGTANDLSNATVVSGGALVLTNGGALAGPIVDNTQVIIDRTDGGTLAGEISGSGSLTKQGSGTVVLTATNSYVGGTVINNGTLQLGNGTSRNGTVVSDITNNAVLVVANPSALTLSNAVSGTGKLVKQGAGTLTLYATNSYSGGTLISAGTLQVGDGGADGSLGTGPITNSGTLFFNSSNNQVVNDSLTGGTLSHYGAGSVTLANTSVVSYVNIGGAAGIASVLNLNGANVSGLTASGTYFGIGNTALNATGIVNQVGGTVVMGGAGTQLLLGNGANLFTDGRYNLYSGSLYATGSSYGVILGVNSKDTGEFNLSGGNLFANFLEVGRCDNTLATNTSGYYTQNGGAAAVTTLGIAGVNGANNIGTYGQFSVQGGSFIATNFSCLAAGNASTANLTLGAGAQVTLPAFPTARGSGSTANLTFDGGTLIPYAGSANYLSGLGNAMVTANGATFNVPSGKDITVAQALVNAGVDHGTLTKQGAGTLALTAYSTYDGQTTVSQGSLLVNTVNGTISGPVTVAGGALFGGDGGTNNGGTVVSLTVEANGVVAPGNAPQAAGILWVAGDCVFNAGGILSLDLAAVPSASSNDLLRVDGTLSSTGPMKVTLNLPSGLPVLNQPYTIVTYGALDANFLGNVTLVTHYPATLGQSGNALTVTFTSTNDSGLNQVTWQGDGSANQWAAGVGFDWTNALGQSTVFVNNDRVRFDDTAANRTANLSGTLLPASVTVASSGDYTFVGSGKMSGGTGLTKSGNGTLTLGTANDFSGHTLVAGGVLQFTNGGSVAGFITNNAQVGFNRTDNVTVTNPIVGSGSLVKLNTNTITLTASNAYGGNTTLSAGTLQVNNGATLGSGTVIMNGGNLQSGSGAATLANAIVVNDVAGGSGFIAPNGQNLYLNGNLTGNGAVTKSGAYSLFLAGDNSGFSGALTNNQVNVFFSTPTAGSSNAVWVANGTYLGTQGVTNSSTIYLGALWGTGGTLHNETTGAYTNTYEVGALNQDSTFNGSIADFNAPLVLSKIGTGTLTLVRSNGTYTHTGGTVIKAGTVALTGNNNVLGTGSPVLVNGPTAVLDLTGYSHQMGAVTLAQGMIINGSFSANPLTITNGTVSSSITDGAVVATYGNAVLQGINSYTGNTYVNSGTLQLGPVATLGSSTAIVAAGAVLDVSHMSGGFILQAGQGLGGGGTVNGSVEAAAGSTLTPGAFGVPGTVTFNNNLAMDSGSIFNLDLANTTTPANNDAVVVRGNVTCTGPVTVNFSFLNGAPALGTAYTILTCNGTLDPGLLANLAAPLVLRYSPSFAQVGNTIQVTFSAATPGTDRLVWQGDGWGNQWTVDTANEWTNLLGQASMFFNADQVTFDDTTANTVVNLAGDVAPASILVTNNANAYSLTGTGRITGGTGLTKTGTNSLTLGTANTFLGPVTIADGTLIVANGAALGATNAGTTITGSGTLDLNGQNLDGEVVTAAGAGSGGTGAIVNNGTADQLNALRFLTLSGDTTVGGSRRWDVRSNPTASLSGSGNLTKVGPNQVSVVGATVDPALGNIDIQSGIFSFETTSTSLGDPAKVLTVETNATFQLYQTTNLMNKQFVLNGGAIRLYSGAATFVGPLTANAGDLTNTINTSGGNLNLLGAVGGSGVLTKVSGNTLTFGADNNSWSGGLTISGGAVQVGTNGAFGSLGTGSVTNNGTLLFNRSDVAGTYGGSIYGVGPVYQAGSGAFTLAGQNFYSGDTVVTNGTLRAGAPNVFSPNSMLNVAAGAALDLRGSAQALTNLVGGGLVTNSVASTTLTVSNGAFLGSIAGASTLVKAGPGTLLLAGANSYSGPTIVQGGTLLAAAPTAPVAGYARWFDASSPARVTMDANNRVSAWADLSPNAANATQGTAANQPLYVPNVLNGLGAVYFMGNGGSSSNLAFTRDSTIRSVFSIFKGTSFLLTDSSAYNFHRLTDTDPTNPLWDPGNSSANIRGGSTYVNGLLVNGTTYNMPTDRNNGFNLVEVLTTGNVTASSFNRDRTYHAGTQYQAETLLYDFVLTEAQRLQNELYLNTKWFASTAPLAALPANSAVQIAAGATLDLGWSSAAIGSLSDNGGAGGTLTNSSAKLSSLAVGDSSDSSFSGSISGQFAVSKVGSGTLTLSGVSSYTGSTTVSNGTLLVNGQLGASPVTVAAGTLGGSGVVGGAVTVNPGAVLSPGASIGTLSLGSDLALAGSLLAEVDNSQSPANDRVAVSGIATLGGNLRVRVTGGTVQPTDQFVILTAGTVSGSFANLDANGLVAVENMPGATFHVTITATSVVLDNYTAGVAVSFPRLTSVKVSSGNLFLSGSGGPTGSGHNYYVLGSTNVALRLTNWTVLATNAFNSDGSFSTSLPVTPGEPRKFYRLQVP